MEKLSETDVLYARSPSTETTMAGDRAAIYHKVSRKAITLNANGTLLWNTMETPQSSEELAQRLLGTYPGLELAQAEHDVSQFLNSLMGHEFLQTT